MGRSSGWTICRGHTSLLMHRWWHMPQMTFLGMLYQRLGTDSSFSPPGKRLLFGFIRQKRELRQAGLHCDQMIMK